MAQFKEIAADAPLGAKIGNWFGNRFPTALDAYRKHMAEYYAPKNFNIWYAFGILATVVLAIQIISGIFLVMHYKPDATKAFAAVEYIMRDVPGGWFIRYMHSTGASAFFIVVYLHMFRGLLYGSYRKPRELVWLFGCGIFLCLMAEAFMGYVLPWGQMSYWGAAVIINLFGAIPLVGSGLSELVRGDFVISDATLNRFFSFHVIAVPLVLIGLVVAHLLALHDVGSNNPDGVEIKAGPKGNRWSPTAPTDGIPFHPYYTVHDTFVVCVFLILFFAVLFFVPEGGGYFLEVNNFIPADPMAAPAHVAPVWYFTAFYAMLRATNDMMVDVLLVVLAVATIWTLLKSRWSAKGKIALVVVALVLAYLLKNLDAKFWGVVVMGAAVITLCFLPWLDRSPVKSIRYRPGWHKWLLALFVVTFFILMALGVMLPGPLSANPKLGWFTNEFVSMILSLIYFGFFWLMPWWSQCGQFKQPPERVNFTPHAH
jgi:ubiquinol-cytochrome c reductase cytochrome b subunit